MKEPPKTLTLRFCTECGRDDRYTPFTGARHFWRGAPCKGQPVEIVYERSSVSGEGTNR